MSGPREEMISGRWYRDHPELVEARVLVVGNPAHAIRDL